MSAWPFSVGFPLVIRRSPQHDSIAICGANRGEGWPILCQVPIDTFHEKDTASIVAACTAYLDHEKEQELKKELIAALKRIADSIPMDRSDAEGFARDMREIARVAIKKAQGK